MRCPLLILSLGVFAVSASAQNKDSPTEPLVLPGHGIASPDGKIAFFPSTGGGIDALDLASGRLLWSSKGASKPLIARDGKLFALAAGDKGNEVRIVIFNADDGKTLIKGDAIKLPDWANTDWMVGGASGHSFRPAGYLAGGHLLFVWEAKTWYAGGEPPPPEVENAARKNADGVAAIDIATGKVNVPDNPKHVTAVERRFPADMPTVTRNGLTFTQLDQPIKGKAFQMRRIIQASNPAGVAVWRFEVRAPVILPPRP